MKVSVSDTEYNLIFSYIEGRKQVERIIEAEGFIEDIDNLSQLSGVSIGQQYFYTYIGTNLCEIKTTSANGEYIKTHYTFDDKGKLISSDLYNSDETDILGATAYEYNDTADLSLTGNISKVASVGKITDNIVKNHNLESTNNWSSMKLDDDGCVYSSVISTEEVHTGAKSLKLSVTDITSTGGAAYYQRFYIDDGVLEAGKTYTASGYIKTTGITRDDNASTTRDYGASIMISTVKSDGTKSRTYSENIKVTEPGIDEGWQRVHVTFTVASNAERVALLLVLRNGTGTAYFDSIQLEESSYPTEYNLLENNGFTYADTSSYATDWSRYNLEASDVVESGKMKIIGSPETKKGVYQDIEIAGATQEDTYTFGGWSEAFSAPKTSDRWYSIYPMVYYRNSAGEFRESKRFCNFNTDLSIYRGINTPQFIGGMFSLESESDPDAVPFKIRILVCY